jgi:hypothetical protein
MRKLLSYAAIFTVLLQLFALASCEVKRPHNILSQGKMEDILYDYHIARAISDNLPGNESYKQKLYIEAVFKKYDITEAQFDLSMKWYSRNTEDLSDIYKEVDKRLKSNLDDTNKLMSATQHSPEGATSGDSLDLWSFPRTARLNGDDMNNRLTFAITADSTFHEKDAIEWSVNFLNPNNGDMMHSAVMSLTIHYVNDSVASQTIKITSSGLRLMRVQGDMLGAIRDVKGFIYLPKGSPNVLIANVKSLMRYHAHGPASVGGHPTPGVSVPPQTAPNAQMHNPINPVVPPNKSVPGKPNTPGAAADTSKSLMAPTHRLTPEELNHKRVDNGTQRNYQIRQQELLKELEQQKRKGTKNNHK